MAVSQLKNPVFSLLIAAALALSACGGGGGGGSNNSGPSAADIAGATCTAVVGAADPVQAALVTLQTTLAGIPQAGPAAAALVAALSKLMDAVDALVNIAQQAAATQNPALIATAGNQTGNSLACGLNQATDALQTLAGSLTAGTPAAAQIATIQAQINAIQATLLSNPFASSGVPGLSTLSTQMTALSNQLFSLYTLLPAQVTGMPEAQLMVLAMQVTVANTATLMNAVGSLNANATGSALTNFYNQFANTFVVLGGILPGQLSPVAAQVAGQVYVASAAVVPVLREGVVTILTPVFAALQTVLGGSVSGPAQFQVILMSLIASTPVSGQFATLVQTLSGGGSVPTLTSQLAGVPVLGQLVQQILGSSGNPTAVLLDVLNGAPGMPTLVATLLQLPNLGGGSTPSVAAVTALIQGLLSLNGGGVPVISDLLAQLGSFADLSAVTGLLNGLL